MVLFDTLTFFIFNQTHICETRQLVFFLYFRHVHVCKVRLGHLFEGFTEHSHFDSCLCLKYTQTCNIQTHREHTMACSIVFMTLESNSADVFISSRCVLVWAFYLGFGDGTGRDKTDRRTDEAFPFKYGLTWLNSGII